MHTLIPPSKQFGTTLIEILTVLAIITTLSSQLGGFEHLLIRQRITADGLTLQQLLSLARYNAVRHNDNVVVCPYSNQRCSNNWNNAISVFSDHDGNKQINDNDQLLRVWQSEGRDSDISWNNRRYLSFKANGMNKNPGTFTLCPKHGEDKDKQAKMLTINMGGRSYFQKDHNQDGIVESYNAGPDCE
ncbi:type IV fimbrial biogenesis protein FimT [Sinobacterium caligoides]|uniref:Type II secretion system protein H n=1 Tax=Sinobacterium caligoides TaxID=933926 RepID=A0A3N2D4M5_9GAMM|nr:GspH/FimT family protein [Sinobacterium caligoides]ROR94741.1 type IV fimbrial biogenesis protein FimT [Sinobacterium caligoides]